jgi:hypothetical protein
MENDTRSVHNPSKRRLEQRIRRGSNFGQNIGHQIVAARLFPVQNVLPHPVYALPHASRKVIC